MHRLRGVRGVEHELERARGHADRPEAARQVQVLHLLERQPRVEAECGGLLAAACKHLRRVVDAVDIDALEEVVEQEPAGTAAHVQGGLAVLPDRRKEEWAVLPVGGVAA